MVGHKQSKNYSKTQLKITNYSYTIPYISTPLTYYINFQYTQTLLNQITAPFRAPCFKPSNHYLPSQIHQNLFFIPPTQ